MDKGGKFYLVYKGVSLACRLWFNNECWLGSFVIFQGIRISIAKKDIFVIFQGGGGPPVPPSGSTHMYHLQNVTKIYYIKK